MSGHNAIDDLIHGLDKKSLTGIGRVAALATTQNNAALRLGKFSDLYGGRHLSDPYSHGHGAHIVSPEQLASHVYQHAHNEFNLKEKAHGKKEKGEEQTPGLYGTRDTEDHFKMAYEMISKLVEGFYHEDGAHGHGKPTPIKIYESWLADHKDASAKDKLEQLKGLAYEIGIDEKTWEKLVGALESGHTETQRGALEQLVANGAQMLNKALGDELQKATAGKSTYATSAAFLAATEELGYGAKGEKITDLLKPGVTPGSILGRMQGAYTNPTEGNLAQLGLQKLDHAHSRGVIPKEYLPVVGNPNHN